jgi:hypothetical protein
VGWTSPLGRTMSREVKKGPFAVGCVYSSLCCEYYSVPSSDRTRHLLHASYPTNLLHLFALSFCAQTHPMTPGTEYV